MGHFGLSDIEYELMSFFWDSDGPVTFSEVLTFCNEKQGRNWAKTTAHTYLTRLVQKGLLNTCHPGTKRAYYAAISKNELAHTSAQEFINTSFSGSLKNFLVSLTGNQPISPEEAKELHQILDQIVDPDSSSQ